MLEHVPAGGERDRRQPLRGAGHLLRERRAAAARARAARARSRVQHVLRARRRSDAASGERLRRRHRVQLAEDPGEDGEEVGGEGAVVCARGERSDGQSGPRALHTALVRRLVRTAPHPTGLRLAHRTAHLLRHDGVQLRLRRAANVRHVRRVRCVVERTRGAGVALVHISDVYEVRIGCLGTHIRRV